MSRPAWLPGSARDRHRNEQGSGTVLVLAMAMVIGLLAAAVVGVGQATVLRHRAGAAADLAALAAATATQNGADGCAAATTVAGRARAVLTSCTASGLPGVMEIHVRITGTVLDGLVLTATGVARAGPATVG